MAGKVRHLLHAHGRYSARVAVPAALRSIVGKRELLKPLGPDRKTALADLPEAVADMQATLKAARARLQEGRTVTAPARRGRPLTAQQMARQHYQTQVQFDQEVREEDQRAGAGFIDESEFAELGRAMAGAATNTELEALVGRILTSFRLRGHTKITSASPEFRKTAMALAVAEHEALAVAAARDEGDTTAATTHPLLAPEQILEPAPASPRILGPDSSKTLSEIVSVMMLVP